MIVPGGVGDAAGGIGQLSLPERLGLPAHLDLAAGLGEDAARGPHRTHAVGELGHVPLDAAVGILGDLDVVGDLLDLCVVADVDLGSILPLGHVGVLDLEDLVLDEVDLAPSGVVDDPGFVAEFSRPDRFLLPARGDLALRDGEDLGSHVDVLVAGGDLGDLLVDGRRGIGCARLGLALGKRSFEISLGLMERNAVVEVAFKLFADLVFGNVFELPGEFFDGGSDLIFGGQADTSRRGERPPI